MLEERMSKEFGKPVLKIIPLDLDGFMFDSTWDNWKQQHLVQRLAPNFKGWKSSDSKFNSALEQVVQALRSDEGAREKPPTPKLGKR
jgi:hypothetical protein